MAAVLNPAELYQVKRQCKTKFLKSLNGIKNKNKMNEAYNQKSIPVPTSAKLNSLNHFVSLAVVNFVHPLILMTASLGKQYS